MGFPPKFHFLYNTPNIIRLPPATPSKSDASLHIQGKYQPLTVLLQKHGPLDETLPESSTRSSTLKDWFRCLVISYLCFKFKSSFSRFEVHPAVAKRID